MDAREPRNPFDLLLLVVGVIFVLTVLALVFVPVLEQKALDAGTVPPPSPFRDALRRDGVKWVLGEVALLVLLGLASMGLDRYRRWQRDSTAIKKFTAESAETAERKGNDSDNPQITQINTD